MSIGHIGEETDLTVTSKDILTGKLRMTRVMAPDTMPDTTPNTRAEPISALHTERALDIDVATGRLTATIVDPDGLNDTDLEKWRDLALLRRWANPFFTPSILHPALLAYGGEVKLLVILNEQQDWCGLLPVVRGASYGKMPVAHWQTWRHVHFYNGMPLIRRGCVKGVFAALDQWLMQKPDGTRFIRLHGIPMQPTLECLFQGIEHTVDTKLAFRVDWEHRFMRAELKGGQSYSNVMDHAFSGKKRKEYRRQFRRLNEVGALSYQVVGAFDGQTPTQTDDVKAVIDDYMALEAKGWKAKTGDPVADPDHRTFFQAVVQNGFSNGTILAISLMQSVTTLSATGSTTKQRPIAMVICLRDGQEASAWKTTFDEALSQYSPGIHVLMEATRIILDKTDIDVLDSCAKENHPVADKLWPQRREIATVTLAASDPLTRSFMICGRMGSRVLSLLKRCISKKPTKDEGVVSP